MLKLSENRLTELFSLISQNKTLYLPIEKGGQTEFGKWSDNKNVSFQRLNTAKSAKDFFFPQSETLVSFKTEGKNISIIENETENDEFVIFGVRECDAKSFEILDRVFLSKPADVYYKARRENAIVITMSCSEPEETCFCSVFGIDPSEPSGDISTWLVGKTLYWKSLTEKGNAFTQSIKGIFDITDENDDTEIENHKSAINDIMTRLPLKDLDLSSFSGDFNSPEWEELSKCCIGCGTCTFVCPTCQCYDIRDYDTGNGIQRYRCWDSCMYSDFTKMAHGNPRTTRIERFRQRFMHKLVYFPENNDGVYSCVGCGRCLAKCPVSMNIVKVCRGLEVDKNE